MWQIKHSNCDKTQKQGLWQNSKNELVTTLINWNFEKAKKLKCHQNKQIQLWNSNFYKTQKLRLWIKTQELNLLWN